MAELIESVDELDAERIATIDLGGTLITSGDKSSTFYEINTALGLSEDEEGQIFERHTTDEENQIINYLEHAEDLGEKINAAELKDRTDLHAFNQEIYELIQDREVMDYASSFVSDLKALGYQPMLLSSTPADIGTYFAEELDIPLVYRMRDYQFTGEEFESIFVNDEAKLGKHQVIEALQDQGSEVYHFGNGGNDVKAKNAADGGLRQWNWAKNPRKAYRDAIREVV